MAPTTLVDYCDTPTCEGKFLQLIWRGRQLLLFAPTSRHRYHNQLLAHFAEEHAIAHHWSGDNQLAITHPELEILGGGRFRADGETLELWDDSQAYGRFREPGLREAIADATHPWSRLRVVIR